jgi:hypothetical protein
MKVGTVHLTPGEVAEILREHVAAKVGNPPTAIEVVDQWGKTPLVITYDTHDEGRQHKWVSTETQQVVQG